MPRLPVAGQADVCLRCAAAGPTCCEPEEGVGLAPLTPGDIRRIQTALGIDPSKFAQERGIDEEEAEALEAQDPILRGLIGPRRTLLSLAKHGRACVFHDRALGCSLPYAIRPLLCRRFPIVRDRGRLRVNPGGDCLAVEQARDMPDLLHLLGVDERELAQIDRLIREDLREAL